MSQIDWKKYRQAVDMRSSGMTLRDVGIALHVSGERVRQMCNQYERLWEQGMCMDHYPKTVRGIVEGKL